MNQTTHLPKFARSCLPYVLVTMAAMALVHLTTGLFATDWRVPIAYQWDGLLSATIVKGVITGEWSLLGPMTFERMGAPAVSDWTNIPFGGLMITGLFRCLGWFSEEPGVVLNAYGLVTFVLPALSFLWVARDLDVKVAVAAPFALLYAFAPYHFYRLYIGHVFLSAYFMLPLMVWLCLAIYRDSPLLFENNLRPGVLHRRNLFPFLIVAGLASSANYYAFFGAFFLLVSGGLASWQDRTLRPLANAGAFIALLVLVLAINIAPALLAMRGENANPNLTKRQAVEILDYAPTLTEMLSPVDGHRIPALAALKGRLSGIQMPMGAALGTVAAIGMILLLALLVLRAKGAEACPDLRPLAALNLAGLLLALKGGAALLLGLVGPTIIRDYSRMTICISTFSLLALALLFNYFASRRGPVLAIGLAWTAGLWGVWDQTPTWAWLPAPNTSFASHYPGGLPPFFRTRYPKADFESDRAFYGKLEQLLPRGTAIWQAPHSFFFGAPSQHRMKDYSHLKAYLHTDHLRFSYGLQRQDAKFPDQKALAAMDWPQKVEVLREGGFRGVVIDTYGYPNEGEQVIQQLQKLLGAAVTRSQNGRLAFFTIQL